MSDSLRPHESQHARPPGPSPTPGVHSDTSIESMMPSSHLILCRPLLLLPPIRPNIRVISSESTLHKVTRVLEVFSFNIIPSKEIPGLISFRMDWLLSYKLVCVGVRSWVKIRRDSRWHSQVILSQMFINIFWKLLSKYKSMHVFFVYSWVCVC